MCSGALLQEPRRQRVTGDSNVAAAWRSAWARASGCCVGLPLVCPLVPLCGGLGRAPVVGVWFHQPLVCPLVPAMLCLRQGNGCLRKCANTLRPFPRCRYG